MRPVFSMFPDNNSRFTSSNGGQASEPFNLSVFFLFPPPEIFLTFFNIAPPSAFFQSPQSDCRIRCETVIKSFQRLPTVHAMPPYAITPFKDLCLTVQPLNPHLRPMPAVSITTLPLKDKRDPIWANPCCLQCAKLVGSVDLYCVAHPNKNEHKCIRCFNLNITCVPIPQEHFETFRSIQVFFKTRDLKFAFLFRRAWIVGMNNEPSARIGRQFFLINRNIERLINTQLATVRVFCLREYL